MEERERKLDETSAKMEEEKFLAWLEQVPKLCGDEKGPLAFTEEQRKSIFVTWDANADGGVDLKPYVHQDCAGHH